MITTLFLLNFWFPPEIPADNPNLCGLSAVVCEVEDVNYLKKYIKSRLGDTGVAIAGCESRFKVDAVGYNTNKTYDKGIWQINDIHGLSDECRFDLECSTNWVVDKVKRDGNWNAWSCSRKIILQHK